MTWDEGEWEEVVCDKYEEVVESFRGVECIGSNKLREYNFRFRGDIIDVQKKSPRLLFVYIRLKDCKEPTLLIIKDRDNFYNQEQLGIIYNKIEKYQQEKIEIIFNCFPEVVNNCRDSDSFQLTLQIFFHIKQIFILQSGGNNNNNFIRYFTLVPACEDTQVHKKENFKIINKTKAKNNEEDDIDYESENTNEKKRKRAKRSNKNRASIFAAWAKQTFNLRHFFQVLDVAGGGHGALSFDLYFKHLIKSIIIDPRFTVLEPKQLQYLKHSSNQTTSQNNFVYTNDNIIDSKNEIENIKINIEDNNIINSNTNVENNIVEENKEDHSVNEDFKIQTIVSQYPGYRQICGLFNSEFIESPVGSKVWANSTLILGLHPDQATEDIVDFAIKDKKAFAVIPCCVFPKLYPKRFHNGKHVKSYLEFCNYLQAKHDDIQRTTLSFTGRNIVLYWIPQ